MVEDFYVKETAGQSIIAKTGNAQIVTIDSNGEFTWSYVDAGTQYKLTGYTRCYDNDTSVLYAQTTTKNVYIPIIDGKTEFVYGSMPETAYTASTNKSILPIVLILLLFSQL